MAEVITLTAAGKKFWGTKKTTVRVTVTDKPVRTYGGYWSGGSRSEWWMQKRGGVMCGLAAKTSPFDSSGDPEYTPTADTAIVQGGIFNGKPAGLSIYVSTKEGWTW